VRGKTDFYHEKEITSIPRLFEEGEKEDWGSRGFPI